MRNFKALAPLILAALLLAPFTVSPDNNISISTVYADGNGEPPPMPSAPSDLTSSASSPMTAESSATGDEVEWTILDELLLQAVLLLTL